jgi:hypothetical protein
MSIKTVLLSNKKTTSTIDSDDRIAKTTTQGIVTSISYRNLLAQMTTDLQAQNWFATLHKMATDGVGIVYRTKSGNSQRVAKLEDWPALQSGGEVADGVIVWQGDYHLIIAPNHTYGNWAQDTGAHTGTFFGGAREEAISNFNGRAQTEAALDSATLTANDAPMYCYNYTRNNGAGVASAPGVFWLPSLGEMIFVAQNINRINYAMGLITGATIVSPTYEYWTSTEASASSVWRVKLSDIFLGQYTNKTNGTYYSRPVSNLGVL